MLIRQMELKPGMSALPDNCYSSEANNFFHCSVWGIKCNVPRLWTVYFILTLKPVRVDRGDGTAVLIRVLVPQTTTNQVVRASVVRKLSGVMNSVQGGVLPHTLVVHCCHLRVTVIRLI